MSERFKTCGEISCDECNKRYENSMNEIDRLTAELAEWENHCEAMQHRAEQAEKKLIQAEKEISAWREINIQAARTVEQAERERDRYREALEKIAVVNEPHPLSYCMRTAREALGDNP